MKNEKEISFEEKRKEKEAVKESLKHPVNILADRINELQEVAQRLEETQIELKNKLGDLECRLDEHGYPAGTSRWSKMKFNQDGSTEEQGTDNFIETKTHLYSE